MAKIKLQEEDTVPTEEEVKRLRLKEDLEKIQELYWSAKNEEAETLLREKLIEHFSVDIFSLRNGVASYVKENAIELASQVTYIVPNEDWSKCLNGEEEKRKFLEEEASKSEVWTVKALRTTHLPKVWAVVFEMKTMEVDDEFYGYAYVSEAGKVKHIFAQAE